MRPFLLGAVLSAFAVLVSGCLGIVDRTSGRIEYLYQPTCEDAELVSIPFRDGSKMSSEGRIAKAYCTVVLPLTVVDFPFEVVLDTVFITIKPRKRSHLQWLRGIGQYP